MQLCVLNVVSLQGLEESSLITAAVTVNIFKHALRKVMGNKRRLCFTGRHSAIQYPPDRTQSSNTVHVVRVVRDMQ